MNQNTHAKRHTHKSHPHLTLSYTTWWTLYGTRPPSCPPWTSPQTASATCFPLVTSRGCPLCSPVLPATWLTTPRCRFKNFSRLEKLLCILAHVMFVSWVCALYLGHALVLLCCACHPPGASGESATGEAVLKLQTAYNLRKLMYYVIGTGRPFCSRHLPVANAL